MRDDTVNVLFLCTGNSARSILAEVLLNDLGEGRLRAYSAGSHPAGKVNPDALAKLVQHSHATDGLTSKSWDRFSGPNAPSIDIVITVCENAAGASCPVWNGSPVTAHWGIPDPAAEIDEGTRRVAFDLAYSRLKRRIRPLVELDLDGLDSKAIEEALQRIHEHAVRDDADA